MKATISTTETDQQRSIRIKYIVSRGKTFLALNSIPEIK